MAASLPHPGLERVPGVRGMRRDASLNLPSRALLQRSWPRRSASLTRSVVSWPGLASAAKSQRSRTSARAEVSEAEAGAESSSSAASEGQVVEFVLVRECSFGQSFFVVGSTPSLGDWDPARALPLTWNEGHVWSKAMELSPAELDAFEFKFIMMSEQGEVEWQPSENHRLGDGTGPDIPSPSRNALVIHRAWEGEELFPLPEEWTAGATSAEGAEEEAAAPEPAVVGNGALNSTTKSRRPPSKFAEVVSKDAEWGKSVLAQLLGTWGRKTLMDEEESRKS